MLDELRGLLRNAVMKSGEGSASLNEVRMHIRDSVQAFEEAHNMVAAAQGNGSSDSLFGAMEQFTVAKEACIQLLTIIEQVDQACRSGQENTETFIGNLGG